MSNRNVFRIPVPKEALEFTGERFTTAVEGEIRHEHFHRYLFALQFCKGRSVLDIASGEGYGSALLGTVAREVIGVDTSAEAVRHANFNYYDRVTSFRIGSAENLPIADQSVDVVVSFETLEHVEGHESFLREIKRVLRPDGLLIMSSPDREVYSGEHHIQNPHHVKELTRAEFHQLVHSHFAHAKFLAQKALTGSVIAMDEGTPNEDGFQGFRRLYENYFECEPGLGSAMYLIGVASQCALPKIAPGAFDDREFQLGLYAELQRRHEEMLRRDARIAELNEKMSRSESETANCRSAAEQACLRLEETSKVLADREVQLARLRNEAEESRQRIEQTSNILAERESQLAMLRTEAEDSSLRIERTSTELAEREAQVVTLRIEAQRLAEELNERNERIRALLTQFGSLREVLKQQEVQLAKLANETSTQQAQLCDRSSEAATLAKREKEQAAVIAARGRQVADLDTQVRNLRNSASWKLTAPLRYVVEGASHLLNLFYKTSAFRWTGKGLARLISSVAIPGGRWLLPHNPLFDDAFYREQYKDAAKSKNPWAHYLAFGADEDRNPHPLFDTSFYLERYPDVAASGINPIVHYFEYGATEGRNPHAAFDTSYYLDSDPDLRGRINPLLHYWLYGQAEGRRPSPPSDTMPPAAEISKSELIQTEQTQPQVCALVHLPGPSIGVIMPTYNTPERCLRLAIDSVRRQEYVHWRLYIYDDGSTNPETLQVLREYATGDNRVLIQFGMSNTGIARATNAALAMAQGDYVTMLDHDDELTPNALLEVVQILRTDSTIDALYTDQAYLSADGKLVEPFFKPDWSPELFRGVMFVGHLLVVRLDLARKLGGFDPNFDRVQDFEFMLRLSEATRNIRHLPKVLYYWRRIPGSVAFGGNEKGLIEGIQAAAVNGHLSRLRIPATGVPHPRLSHRLLIEPNVRTTFPKVSVVVRNNANGAWPTECMRSVLDRSTYPNLNISVSSEIMRALALPPARVQVYDSDLVYNACSSSDYTVWIDADLEVMTPNWIELLLLYCEQADIALAAPLIVKPDDTVWHAGLVLGMDGSIGYSMRGLTADSDGYAGSLSCAREVTAVSGECFMVSAASFSEVGGAVRYYKTPVFQGADFALRGFTMKRRNICTPRVVLRKTGVLEEPSGWDLDRELFWDRWSGLARLGDPYHNPNFVPLSPGYCLAKTAAGMSV